MTYEDERRRLDISATAWGLLVATVTGLGFVTLRYSIGFFTTGITQKVWSASGQVFIALMWSSAWFAGGFLLGFLFGIPKVPQGAKDGAQTGAANSPTNASGHQDAPRDVPYQLRVNTNLEEISDWLTKILVGATLTQLVKVPSKISDAAKFMADGMGGLGTPTFAASILVYFSSVGFFAGYVLTRMFFAGAFVRSDLQLTASEIGKLRDTRTTLDPVAPADDEALVTAQKSRAIKITESLTGALAAAIASGALLTNDPARAVQAARIAADKSPDDPRVHLNYAIALHRNNADPGLVRKELEKAREIVNRKFDAAVTEDIYNSIIYFCLYLPAPEGFTKAIEYGEEYLRTNTPSRPSIWINLACAYGQQYGNLPLSGGANEQLQPVKKKALAAVQNAINMSSEAAIRFRQLATGIPDPNDDDLKVFASDEQFKQMVGLS